LFFTKSSFIQPADADIYRILLFTFKKDLWLKEKVALA